MEATPVVRPAADIAIGFRHGTSTAVEAAQIVATMFVLLGLWLLAQFI